MHGEITPSYGIQFTEFTSTVPPPNTADLGTEEKAAVFGNRRYWGSYITYKTLNWDLEMGGGIGGGEAVLGGAVLGGGDDCTQIIQFILEDVKKIKAYSQR